MINVLRAEFRRLFRDKGLHVLLLLSLIFYILNVVIIITYSVNETPERAIETFRETLTFPSSIFTVLSISFILFLVLAPAITARIVGADYQHDTWKTIIPRCPHRKLLLSAKYVVVMLSVVLIIICGFLLLAVGSMVAALYLSPSVSLINFSEIPIEQREIAAEFISFILWYTSVGMLFTVAARSVVTGAFATLSFYFICVFVRMYSPELISIWFAPSHFSNLIPQPDSPVIFAGGHRLGISSYLSWIAILIHVLGNIVVSFLLFARQDFDSRQ